MKRNLAFVLALSMLPAVAYAHSRDISVHDRQEVVRDRQEMARDRSTKIHNREPQPRRHS